jgi:hypothetical protein
MGTSFGGFWQPQKVGGTDWALGNRKRWVAPIGLDLLAQQIAVKSRDWWVAPIRDDWMILASSMELPEPLHPLPSRCAMNSCQKSRLVGGTDWAIALKGRLGSTHQTGGNRKRWVRLDGDYPVYRVVLLAQKRWVAPIGLSLSKADWARPIKQRSNRKRWLAPIGL